MAGNEATTKFFEALNETSDAFIDAVRATSDRNHRVSTAIIEQTQEGQREAVELAKKWIAAPFDLLGLYGSVVENSTKAQGRALEVTRLWFGEMSDAQKETRDIVQRMVGANRSASEATIELARGAFSRATEAVQAARDGNGRKAPARESAKASEAKAAQDNS